MRDLLVLVITFVLTACIDGSMGHVGRSSTHSVDRPEVRYLPDGRIDPRDWEQYKQESADDQDDTETENDRSGS